MDALQARYIIQGGTIPPSGTDIKGVSTDSDNKDVTTFPTTSPTFYSFPGGLDITTAVQTLREKLLMATDPIPFSKREKIFSLPGGYDVYIKVQVTYNGQNNGYMECVVDDHGVEKNFGWNNFGTLYWSSTNFPIKVTFSAYLYDTPLTGYSDLGFVIAQQLQPYQYYSYRMSLRRISATADAYPYLANQIAGDDPYSTDNNNTPIGGYGDFDYSSEEELPASLPTLSAAQVGFVSLWNPTVSEMQNLANYLWTGTFDPTNFRKIFADPMECVLSVGIIPITPTTEEHKREIVFAGDSHSGVNVYPVTQQFYIVDMGALHINGKSNSAMDYSPYAKASIYLPYCGTYALDVDEIMDSDIYLEYHIDVYTGACVAYLTINGHINSDGNNVHSVMYQFTGNVLASIPITGNDHSQFIQSMLFMGATAAATVATSGASAGAAAAGADLGAETAATGFNRALAGSAINTVMSMKPNVLHSGNLSSTAGLLGGQHPYITMAWSNLCRPDDEYKLVGMPLHKSGTLSDFSGFTIVSACHMDNILCTEQELAMIEQALAKGVII